MIVRKITGDDYQQLATLFFLSVREISSKDYSQEQVKAWAPADRDPVQWASSFANKHVFVAEISNTLAGFGELEGNGHIDRFYIHPQFAATGVGRRIYQQIEEEAKSRSIKRLFVEASITARPFFEKMGFQLINQQTVLRTGVSFTNYKMEKFLV